MLSRNESSKNLCTMPIEDPHRRLREVPCRAEKTCSICGYCMKHCLSHANIKTGFEPVFR